MADAHEQELGFHPDSTRFCIEDDNAGIESDSEVEETFDCEDWDDEELWENMTVLVVNVGDDPLDEDWVPPELKKKKQRTGQ